MDAKTPEQVREVFRQIAFMEIVVEGPNAKWWISFAWNVVNADKEALAVLWPALAHLLDKNNLP